jgi:hypothetical protein
VKITVLAPNTAFVHLYSCLPFHLDRKRRFHFTDNWDWVLNHDRSNALIVVRWFQGASHADLTQRRELLERLRQKYEFLAYFDDDDSASSPVLDVLPYVDKFWKKQLYRDRSVYAKPLRGNRLFTDFYWKSHDFGSAEASYPSIADLKLVSKMRTAWNLGIGTYPQSRLKERSSEYLFRLNPRLAALPWSRPRRQLGPKRPVCHARFSPKGYSPSVAYQRSLFLDLVRDRQAFATGVVDKKTYAAELEYVRAVLSPFGWGEVCFRDFEALLNGALLIKPDMSHLETFPDIYLPELTIKWDGSDLIAKTDDVLGWSDQTAERLSEEAWNLWIKAWDQLLGVVDGLLADWLEARR